MSTVFDSDSEQVSPVRPPPPDPTGGGRGAGASSSLMVDAYDADPALHSSQRGGDEHDGDTAVNRSSQVVLAGVPIARNADGSTTRVLTAQQFRDLFQQAIAPSHFRSGAGSVGGGAGSAAPIDSSVSGADHFGMWSDGGRQTSTPLGSRGHTPPRGVGGAATKRPPSARHPQPHPPTPGHSDGGFIDPFRCSKFRFMISAPSRAAGSVGSRKFGSRRQRATSAAASIQSGALQMSSSRPPSAHRFRDPSDAAGGSPRRGAPERATDAEAALRLRVGNLEHELQRRDQSLEELRVRTQQDREAMTRTEQMLLRGRPAEAAALQGLLDQWKHKTAFQAQRVKALEEQVYQLKQNSRACRAGELQVANETFAAEVRRLTAALAEARAVGGTAHAATASHPRIAAVPSCASSGGGSGADRARHVEALRQRDLQIEALHRRLQAATEEQRLSEAEAAKWRAAYQAEKPRLEDATRRLEALKSAPVELARMQDDLRLARQQLTTAEQRLAKEAEVRGGDSSKLNTFVDQLVEERDTLVRQLRDREVMSQRQREAVERREAELDEAIRVRAKAAADEERALAWDREQLLLKDAAAARADTKSVEELLRKAREDHADALARMRLKEQQRQEAMLTTMGRHERDREVEIMTSVREENRRLTAEVSAAVAERSAAVLRVEGLLVEVQSERAAREALQQTVRGLEQRIRELQSPAPSVQVRPTSPGTHIASPASATPPGTRPLPASAAGMLGGPPPSSSHTSPLLQPPGPAVTSASVLNSPPAPAHRRQDSSGSLGGAQPLPPAVTTPQATAATAAAAAMIRGANSSTSSNPMPTPAAVAATAAAAVANPTTVGAMGASISSASIPQPRPVPALDPAAFRASGPTAADAAAATPQYRTGNTDQQLPVPTVVAAAPTSGGGGGRHTHFSESVLKLAEERDGGGGGRGLRYNRPDDTYSEVTVQIRGKTADGRHSPNSMHYEGSVAFAGDDVHSVTHHSHPRRGSEVDPMLLGTMDETALAAFQPVTAPQPVAVKPPAPAPVAAVTVKVSPPPPPSSAAGGTGGSGPAATTTTAVAPLPVPLPKPVVLPPSPMAEQRSVPVPVPVPAPPAMQFLAPKRSSSMTPESVSFAPEVEDDPAAVAGGFVILPPPSAEDRALRPPQANTSAATAAPAGQPATSQFLSAGPDRVGPASGGATAASSDAGFSVDDGQQASTGAPSSTVSSGPPVVPIHGAPALAAPKKSNSSSTTSSSSSTSSSTTSSDSEFVV